MGRNYPKQFRKTTMNVGQTTKKEEINETINATTDVTIKKKPPEEAAFKSHLIS